MLHRGFAVAAATIAGICAVAAPGFANDRSAITLRTAIVANVGRDADFVVAHPRNSEARLLTAAPVEIPDPERFYYSSGQAMIAVQMDSYGKITKASITKTSGFARIDANAIAAVRKSTYQAATVDGEPTGGRYLITVDLAVDR